jgi:hypothetical protein
MTNGLFKYFPNDADKLERFTNGQVYLTPPKYFNDPWDFRIRGEARMEAEVAKELASPSPPQDVSWFTRYMNSASVLEEEACDLQDGLSKIIGLICLTEDPLSRLMWAHYGGSHRGFVAEFEHGDEDASEAGFRLCGSPFGSALKVKYLPKQPLLKRDTSNMEEVCLTKHLCWEPEREWRVMRPLNTGGQHPTKDGFVLVRFKPTQILRVILGLQAAPEVKFQLRQMLNHKEFEHVRKEQMHIDAGSRELKPRPLSW